MFFDQPNTIATNSQATQAPFGTRCDTEWDAEQQLCKSVGRHDQPVSRDRRRRRGKCCVPAVQPQFRYAPDYRNADVQSWNLTLEREIGLGFVVRSSYAGFEGDRSGDRPRTQSGQSTSTAPRPRPPTSAGCSLRISDRRPSLEPSGNSTFHALQLTAERRFSNGFSILANYQFSKAIDDSLQRQEQWAEPYEPVRSGLRQRSCRLRSCAMCSTSRDFGNSRVSPTATRCECW